MIMTFEAMPSALTLIISRLETIEKQLNQLGKQPSPAPTAALYLNVNEAASLIGGQPQTVYNLSSQGKLPGKRKVNGKLLFKRSELIDFIEAGKVQTIEEIKNEVDQVLTQKKGNL